MPSIVTASNVPLIYWALSVGGGKGANEYSACLTRSELMRRVVHGFVEETLGGTLSPFVAYIAEDASVSPKELEELKRLVEELESREEKR